MSKRKMVTEPSFRYKFPGTIMTQTEIEKTLEHINRVNECIKGLEVADAERRYSTLYRYLDRDRDCSYMKLNLLYQELMEKNANDKQATNE